MYKLVVEIGVKPKWWVAPTLKLLGALARVGAVPLSVEHISDLVCNYGFKYYTNCRRV